MHKVLAPVIVVGALAAVLGFQRNVPQASPPPEGYVPDSITAVRIAVAVWSPIYGEEAIAAQTPYRAKLRGEVWTVEGSMPKLVPGGVALAEISKRDGRILRVIHGQ